jgi:GNAT superfamily N-acetyltransferase
MRFIPSASMPHAVERIAQLQFDSWGHLYPSASVERSTHDLLHNHWNPEDPNTVRFAWLAVDDDGIALGVAMLVFDGEVEPADEAELPGPWFAGLVVEPSARQQGVGSALLDHVMSSARTMGFSRLRLVTESKADFYERRGWTTERTVTLNSVPNTVMFTTLTS